jgi:hypothetical protein
VVVSRDVLSAKAVEVPRTGVLSAKAQAKILTKFFMTFKFFFWLIVMS